MTPATLYVKANVHVLGLRPGEPGRFASDDPLYGEAKALADEGTRVERISAAAAKDLGLADNEPEQHPEATSVADATTT